MCRVLAYLGRPVSLEGILYEADSALVRQCGNPRMTEGFLNLAGFGMAAWDERSIREDEPLTYRVTALANYDRNLRNMCRKLAPTCVLAHVRGVARPAAHVISESNGRPPAASSVRPRFDRLCRVPRRRLLPALVLAGAILVAGAPAQAALQTLVQDDASLLHRPPDQVRASMQKLRSLGVDRVRLTANWSALTRDADAELKPLDFDARSPAAYEQARWLGLDEAVRLAQETGLKVMVDVGFWAPHWAATDPPGPRARTNVDPEAFADFAVAVARRYSGTWEPPPIALPAAPSQDQKLLDRVLGGRPTTPTPVAVAAGPLPRVDQFVLWNEPNHPSLLLPQWTGTRARPHPASPTLYARMVRAAYPAAKAIRPDADFLLGNTSSDGGRATAWFGRAAAVHPRHGLRRRRSAPAAQIELQEVSAPAGGRMGASSLPAPGSARQRRPR